MGLLLVGTVMVVMSSLASSSLAKEEMDKVLEKEVDAVLDRLLEADRAFWAAGSWHNITEPEHFVQLYHDR